MGAPWLPDYIGKFTVYSRQFTVSEEEKRDSNTEVTEIGTLRAQRKKEKRLRRGHRERRVRREEGRREPQDPGRKSNLGHPPSSRRRDTK